MEYQQLILGENPYFVSYIQASYEMHCHNEIELFYGLHGNVKVILEDEEYILSEGSILFVSSLSMHQVIIEEDAAAFVVEFGAPLLGAQYNEVAEKSFEKCFISTDDECPYRSRILNPLKKLYKEFTYHKKGSSWAIRGYLFELFAMMVRYVPMQAQSSQNMNRYLKIQKVFDLVQSEYNEEIPLERAAAFVGYEPRAFCRLFKSVTNMTFHDYLNYYRINISMRLLEHKAYSISEVGELTGIPVAKTFSRLFRKYTGMSPSEYRNKYLKGFENN